MNRGQWHKGRILVLGARGMLGQELVATLTQHLDSPTSDQLIAWDLPELDIGSKEDVLESISRVKPDLVINAAAYTNVDGCEENEEQTMSSNAAAPGFIAQACKETDSLLVHFSTDFVFDGRSDDPYKPGDSVNPLSVYGRSKWEGEVAIRSSGCHHLIIRTSWLFGIKGRNFVEAILNKAESGESLRVVNDQVGCPTYAVDLADAVVKLLNTRANSTIHFCNAEKCSWYDFAKEIVQYVSNDILVETMTSEQLHQSAQRPAYSVLDTSLYFEYTGHQPATWRDALSRYMTERNSLHQNRNANITPVNTGDKA